MIIFRRFLVLAVLLFWMGGFTFYAAVVVPVGQEVLGSHRKQGFVTREVTRYLNLAGAVALLLLAWDLARARNTSRYGRWARWAAWVGMALALGLLFWLHYRLDALLNPESFQILDSWAFYAQHQWYLWISTFQLGCAVVFGVLTIRAWREEDRFTRQLPVSPRP
jgi:hypothetical protein